MPGGACAKLGGVAALFYAAGGGDAYGELAFRNLVWMGYHVEEDGRPAEITGYYRRLRTTGWQTDCHTDKLHNFIDAFVAVPAFATAKIWPPEKEGKGHTAGGRAPPIYLSGYDNQHPLT